MRKLALLLAVVGVAGYLGRNKLKAHVPQKLAARFGHPPARPPAPVATPAPAPAAAPAPAPAPKPSDGIQQISVTLHGPLEREVVAQVGAQTGPALALVMNRLVLWWLDPADARQGDQLTALYTLPPGKEPLVEALRYTSQKTGKTYAAYLFHAPGEKYARYYTADGAELEERLKDAPVADYEEVTSFLRDGRHHHGVDFKCDVGTPVVMPFDGKLVRKDWNWHGNGNCLEFVDARTGNHAKFLHLSPISDSLKPGMTFKVGQQVALSGNTGHTTAPHLHYQLESSSGRILDPFKVHATYRAHLPPAAMAAFQAQVAKFETNLRSTP